MRGRRVLSAVLAAAALGAAGCGGARQDANERKGTFAMEVLRASFPAKQAVARPAQLELQVRNAGAHTAPQVAVSLDSFYYAADYPRQASSQRPIWVVERGPGPAVSTPVESQVVSPPGGAQTSYVNTWTLGPLAPGATQTLVWHVTPVKAGPHTVRYTVAVGLAGKAKAQLAGGGPVQGQLTADIAPAPPASHVDPRSGRVVAGPLPVVP